MKIVSVYQNIESYYTLDKEEYKRTSIYNSTVSGHKEVKVKWFIKSSDERNGRAKWKLVAPILDKLLSNHLKKNKLKHIYLQFKETKEVRVSDEANNYLRITVNDKNPNWKEEQFIDGKAMESEWVDIQHPTTLLLLEATYQTFVENEEILS